jgi:hypothetical protein
MEENIIYTEEKIIGSTYEAIFWWNRTESLYHKAFSKIEIINTNEGAKIFFIRKVFDVFLKEFAVRRNIAEGYESVQDFFNYLVEKDNINRIKQGDTEIIDQLSQKFRECDFTKSKNAKTNNTEGKNIRSLLSKCAFLINPNAFSLLDDYTKISLAEITRKSKSSFDNSYSTFINAINEEIIQIEKFESLYYQKLKEFERTEAFNFFIENPNAFKRRIFDKFLWLEKLEDKKIRIKENSGIQRFYQLIE